MTYEANTMTIGPTTAGNFHTDRSVRTRSNAGAGFFPGLMAVVRARLGGKKVAEQFACILGCTVRSAARYLAGDRTPGGDEMIALLIDPVVGPDALVLIIERARRTLSDADFERFAKVMAEAALRAFVRENNDHS